MRRVETLVVGGGVAGAALVYHLARCGRERGASLGPVLLLKRAPPGAHASGRNARLVLPVAGRAAGAAADGSERPRLSRAHRRHGFDRCGWLPPGWRAGAAPTAARRDVAIEVVPAAEVRARVPRVADADFAKQLCTRMGDGVLDPQRLLAFCLDSARRAAVEVELDAEVTVIAGDGPLHVETSRGSVVADRIVNVAGAWAARLGARAAPLPLPLPLPLVRLCPTLAPAEKLRRLARMSLVGSGGREEVERSVLAR